MSRRKEESFYKKNAERMIHIRQSVGLTQSDFAQTLGFKANTIRDIEIGKALTSIDLAMAIEERFYFSFKWVLTGQGEMVDSTYTQNQNMKSHGPFELKEPQIEYGSRNGRLAKVVDNHCDIVKKFKNHEAALKINEQLLEIEALDEGLFEDIGVYVNATLETAKKFLKKAVTKGDRRKNNQPITHPDRRKAG